MVVTLLYEWHVRLVLIDSQKLRHLMPVVGNEKRK